VVSWQGGVILTKDNLMRRNWKGNKLCVFCSNSETIRHLFFECHYARFIWRALLAAFGLPNPRDMEHVAGNWLMGFSKHDKSLIMTGWRLWFGLFGLVGMMWFLIVIT
jgi:hypothetical protein